MNTNLFNAFISLLATILGMKPEAVIAWFKENSKRYSSDRNTIANYISTVLAPVKPQLFILADNKRKILSIGGSGNAPQKPNKYKVEWSTEVQTIGSWFRMFRKYIGDDITIPHTVTSIEEEAFAWTDLRRLRIEANISELSNRICCGCLDLTTVHLPATIERIGYSAFRCCTNLNEINIPDSVQVIEASAFKGCDSLPDDVMARIYEIGGPQAFSEEEM